MSPVAKLVEELAQLGVKLAGEDGRLRIRADRGVLTRELQHRVRSNKEELLRWLEGAASPGDVGAAHSLASDPASDREPFPMSDLQLGFFIADDPFMEYHVRPHCYMELDRPGLDPDRYRQAWNRALAAHRRELCFVNDDLELELLATPPEIDLRVYDLRELAAGEVRTRLDGVRAEMERQALPLDRWPWLDIRLSLWREEGRERARIHYNHNNFFIDGLGTNRLLGEIETLLRDPQAELVPLELSYRDAVLGLERLAASAAGRRARDYWFERIPGLPPPPPLSQRAGRDRRCRSRLERREGWLDGPSWSAFKSKASSQGITPSAAVIAAYALVIGTWSNASRFIFSQMMTRRFDALHRDLKSMLGNFASLYPLEVTLEPGTAFAEQARRIQRQVLEDAEHLEFGGMRVLQELNRQRGSFGSAPSPFVVGSGLFIDGYRLADFTVLETSQTLLDHQFFELADGRYFYVWDLLEEFFPDGLIDDMWGAFGRLLEGLAADDRLWGESEIELIGERDLRQRRQANRTDRELAGTRLEEPLSGQASRRSEAIAVVSGGGSLSYRDLEAWCEALVAEISERGVAAGSVVPVVMDRDRELPPAVMAILRSGAAYAPLDPRLPAARLSLLLEDLGASLVLTQERYARSLEWPGGVTVVPVTPPGPGAISKPAPAVRRDATDLAYVIYTSGSTGAPKGVMIDHRGAVNTVRDVNDRFGVGADDVLLGVSAFNFDLSVYDLFGAVAAGARLVYPDPERSLDPIHWLELAESEQVTVWNSVPALMALLVEAAERREMELPSLRLVMLSGDKIPLDLPAAVRRIAPNARVVSLGGATEASIWSIFYDVEGVDPSWQTIPYGYPMENQTWEVLDREGRPCPRWVPGELYIGGVGLAQGYWNDPEKTRRSFVTDPRSGRRLYRTGDVGRYLPAGCIEWMGRADNQVKIQGHRIEPGEIEAVLVDHPAVRAAAVVVAGSAASDANRPRRLVGCVVPDGDGEPSHDQLEAYLHDLLPAHMVPTAWRILPRLPLTANGKIDRRALAEMEPEGGSSEAAADRAPGAADRTGRVAPSNELEERLQGYWQQILGVSEIGVTDDFFALGGQSFDAIRIFALIREHLGETLNLGDLWNARTIRALAERLGDGDSGADGGAESPIVAIATAGTGTPLFLVHPAGGSVAGYYPLARRIDRPVYGVQATFGEIPAGGRTIPTLAAAYATAIREVQPDGPYRLGGWSSGAMIAFEMAARLEAAGEVVERVVLLDGPSPAAHGTLGDGQLLRWFFEDLALDLPVERLGGELGVELGRLAPEEQLASAIAVLGEVTEAPLDADQLLPSYRLFCDLVVGGASHTPTVIAADLTIVRVEEDVVEEFAAHPARGDADWGWGRWTRGRVRCERVAGNHHSFLGEALVGSWCEVLDEEAV